MKAKMTPGPWIAQYRAQVGPGTQLTQWAVWPTTNGEARVCSLVDGSQAEANARAIAAVPEMIEVLQRAEEIFRNLGRFDETHDLVLAALQKAGVES